MYNNFLHQKDVLTELMFYWMDKKTVAFFDTALCNHTHRPILMDLLSIPLPDGPPNEHYRRTFTTIEVQYKNDVCIFSDFCHGLIIVKNEERHI
jgi:hypothetical protein